MADLDDFIRDQAKKLRENDAAPKTRDEWEKRRKALRERIFAALGDFPKKPSDLEPRILGTLKRDGYTIEKLVFQSRPNVWVTATAYVPEVKGKVPAVLAVHGHWPMARRDPVVQARCLGLVKLGFFVLAIDAFGAGERFDVPARGTYHGTLYGASLWPTGHTLSGMQIYDNRRAVDYLLSRPEVNGKIGVSGASGGGNQSMYVGALDERVAAAVPVCSVGNYQVYLKTACCVCEVVPGALQFTEEGDLLGLTAPRALLVINATKDGIQFSPAEATKSVERAKHIYRLLNVDAKIQHKLFESPHAYNQEMRETMYGFMTLHLKGEGKGEPIPEPKFSVEKTEDITCFPNIADRPKGFAFPPTFAFAAGSALNEQADQLTPDHPEMWEAASIGSRRNLKKILNYVEPKPNIAAKSTTTEMPGLTETTWTVEAEPGIVVHGFIKSYAKVDERLPVQAIVVQYEGWNDKMIPPVWQALDRRVASIGWCNLRGTVADRPKGGSLGGAPDHHVAEHAVWIGRPLLSQWVTDIKAFLVNFGANNGQNKTVVVGIGHAALPALIAAALFPERIQGTVLVDTPVSFVSKPPFAPGTPMGILAPGIMKAGDVPHLVGLVAPRRLIISGGKTLGGKTLDEKELREAFRFTSAVYKASKAEKRLTIATEANWESVEL